MRDQLGERLPRFSEADFSLLREAESDFYGMNYYTAQFARHRPEAALETDYLGNVDELQRNSEGQIIGDQSGVHWLLSCPERFRKHLTRVYKLYGKPIYITENGCPCPGEDQMTCEESVQDTFRIRYFQTHLDAIAQSISHDGSVIKGYFAWSLMDNLGTYNQYYTSSISLLITESEWSDGYGVRFGVTFTDYQTLERTPKMSAQVFKTLVEDRMPISVVTAHIASDVPQASLKPHI
jgi:beta-glucosidase